MQLRPQQRAALRRRGGLVLAAAIIVTAVLQAGRWVVSSQGSLLSRLIRRHTPDVTVNVSADLAGLPFGKDLPRAHFFLWFPGWEGYLRAHWRRTYPAVRSVRLDRHFVENRVLVRLEARIPLVRCQSYGMDGDGVVFPVGPARAATLRTANFSGKDTSAELGHWIAALTHVPPLWDNVAAIHQDQEGDLSLEMRSGTRVAWGPLDTVRATQKAVALIRVLDDAHQRLGGAALADTRFFDEGRIIIKPKSVI